MASVRTGAVAGSAVIDDDTAVMKVWSRRYRDLGSLRTQLVCRLHAVLCDLVPGGFPRQISAAHAIQVLADITAHGPVAAARLEFAHDLVADLRRIDEQLCVPKTPSAFVEPGEQADEHGPGMM